MARLNKIFAALLFCMGARALHAQQLNYNLNRDFLWGVDKAFNDANSAFQTFIKPYRIADLNTIKDSTTFFPRLLAGTKAEEYDKKEKRFELEVYPLLSLQAGAEGGAMSHATYEYGGGAHLLANVGKKFSFSFKGFGVRGRYTSFQDSVIRKSRVLPGAGFAYAGGDSASPYYSSQYFSGYISWSPNRIFNIQAGQDKHFWGDGYRSLFLSDVAAPFPFLKISTTVWHLHYVNLYTIMNDVSAPSGMKRDRVTKYATLHYLGWNATKRINIGLFESIVWQGSDSVRHRGYDVNYLNPVLFFRPTEYSLGSSDNAFVGLSFRIKMFKRQQLYGQVLLDEFLLKEVKAGRGWWANKQGIQAGFKVFDLFRFKRLNFQTELNYVRPYTYAHGSTYQNYSHAGEPLAHPLGANFTESATFLNYRHKRLFIEVKCVYAVYGGDSAGTNYGKDIFLSYTTRPHEYYNYTGQGFYSKLVTTSLRVAYMLDTRMPLKIEAGLADRMHQTFYTTTHTPYVFIGVRTDLANLYSDY